MIVALVPAGKNMRDQWPSGRKADVQHNGAVQATVRVDPVTTPAREMPRPLLAFLQAAAPWGYGIVVRFCRQQRPYKDAKNTTPVWAEIEGLATVRELLDGHMTLKVGCGATEPEAVRRRRGLSSGPTG